MRFTVFALLLFAVPAERSSVPLGLDLYRPVPEMNPLTPEKIALGRRLFFDRRLSRNRTIACVSCHEPQRAFTDGRPVAVGIEGRTGARNVPTLINRVYGKSHFLDGRAESLERQAIQPIQNPKEMDMTMVEVVARLRGDSGYTVGFQSAFHRDANQEDVAGALASYVRSILSGDAPVDRYMNGEGAALSERAKRGLQLFRGKANCTACHVGPTFTDERFHNTGVAWSEPSASSGQAGGFQDEGRFAVSGKPADHGAFKTPTLREIARTAPYMHDGSVTTLEEVVDFYDAGGRPNPHIDREIQSLHLSVEEKQALVAFLKSLSGSIREGMP
jgi:cytochrome c peroxidase